MSDGVAMLTQARQNLMFTMAALSREQRHVYYRIIPGNAGIIDKCCEKCSRDSPPGITSFVSNRLATLVCILLSKKKTRVHLPVSIVGFQGSGQKPMKTEGILPTTFISEH